MAIEKEEIERLAKDKDDQIRIIEENVLSIQSLLIGKHFSGKAKNVKDGQILTEKLLDSFDSKQIWKVVTKNQQTMSSIESLKNEFDAEINEILLNFKEKVDKVQSGDDLLPGVLKMVKVL